ncbi:MAG: ABC transporter ATP-binding protein [Candidatus Odinarchaeota archaeon]
MSKTEGTLFHLEDIVKIYQNPFEPRLKTLVIRGLSLDIIKNEMVIVAGPSGSGKSTLLRLLAGIELPTAGKILFNNLELNKLSSKQLLNYRRRYIGFLHQDPLKNLIKSGTVESNIRLPMKLAGKLSFGQQKSRMKELLELVDMKGYEKRKITKLSGGQKQRIAVLTALTNNPSVILADEPTGELDTSNSLIIMQLLQRIAYELDSTVIAVSHNMDLFHYADSIYQLEKGTIIGQTKKMSSQKSEERKEGDINVSRSISGVLKKQGKITILGELIIPKEFLSLLQIDQEAEISYVHGSDQLVLKKFSGSKKIEVYFVDDLGKIHIPEKILNVFGRDLDVEIVLDLSRERLSVEKSANR